MRFFSRSVWSWALYDWANSAYATAVMAGFFPIFFKQFWCREVDAVVSTARLGLGNAIAGLMVALLAPLLGAMADHLSARKKYLAAFAFAGIISTISLVFVARGHWVIALLVYIMATIGFSAGNIFYDALLTVVSSETHLDVISGLGFALGYIGGGLLFALNVAMSLNPAFFGFSSAAGAIRFSFFTVGIWWAIFSIPLLLFVREPIPIHSKSPGSAVGSGLRQLRATFGQLKHLQPVLYFLIAYWIYIDGVDTIIRMAVDYGMSIGLATRDLILALLITQFTGFPAALGFGYFGKKFGARTGIYFALFVYFTVSVWGAFMQTAREFYILAVVIGLVQGGIQSLSRSMYARLIPERQSAQFFGFYNMMGKFAAILGPVLVGGVGLAVRALGAEQDLASRLSIASISVMFLIGAVFLARVKSTENYMDDDVAADSAA